MHAMLRKTFMCSTKLYQKELPQILCRRHDNLLHAVDCAEKAVLWFAYIDHKCTLLSPLTPESGTMPFRTYSSTPGSRQPTASRTLLLHGEQWTTCHEMQNVASVLYILWTSCECSQHADSASRRCLPSGLVECVVLVYCLGIKIFPLYVLGWWVMKERDQFCGLMGDTLH